ncbi:MAG: SpoIIE family protein phosphatase [Pseudonocardiaceae bacterium]
MPTPGSSSSPQVPPSEVDPTGLLSAAPLAVGLTRGPEHVVELLNPAASSLLGITDAAGAQAVGRPLRAVAPALADCGVIEVLDRVYAAGVSHREPRQRVLRPRADHCEERVVSLTCHPRYGRAGVSGLQWYGVDLTEQVHAGRRLEFLVAAGPALLEASLEHRDVLDRAAHLAVSALGELCVINLRQPDGSLVRAAVVHADPELAPIAEQLRLFPPLPGSPNHQVLDSGGPMLLRLQDSDPWSLASRGQQELLDRLGLASGLVVPIVARGRRLGTFCVCSTQPDRYTDDDVALVEGMALRAGLALDTAALYDSERRAREFADRAAAGTAGLLRVTAALSGAVSPAAIAEVVVSQGADLLGACGAVLFVRVLDGLKLVDATGWSPDTLRQHRMVSLSGGTPLTDTVLTGAPVWLESYQDFLTRYPRSAPVHRGCGYQAAACLPLILEGTMLGAMAFSFTAPRRFSTDDRTLLLTLAGQCAQALDRARLYEEQRGIAATLQAALLPHELPVIPGVELAGRYVAAGEANEVGGDLYDVFASCDPCGAGEADPWSLVIGDVCGKGAAAAALTALIRYTVRAEASHLLAPGDVLRRLNGAIIRQLTTIDARFCTAIYGQLTSTGQGLQVRMACAGHIAPRVLRHDGTVEVGTGGGTILGVYTEPVLACEDAHLSPGDTLLLVTDGVTEARGPGGFYGEERLDALLAGCPGRSAGPIADLITEDVLHFQAGPPHDDVAVLVVQAALAECQQG